MRLNIKETFISKGGIMKSERRIVNISKIFVISSKYWFSLYFYDLDSKHYFKGYIKNKVTKPFSKLLLSRLISSPDKFSMLRMGKLESSNDYSKLIDTLLNNFTLVQTIEYDPS